MTRREFAPRLGVVLGYVAVALAFAWPLPMYLGSHLTGDPGGDTGVYVWNQWVFQHEAATGHNPLSTEQIFSLSRRTDLSQHNYTAFLNVLALPLIPWLGVVTTFNIVYLAATVLTALCAYALARRAFEATRLEAFAGGLAFAWSPALVARSTGHFSLVAAAPLAAFLLSLSYAERTRSTRHAALAGLCMAWAAFCDAYYAVFCLMIAGLYIATTVIRVTKRDRMELGPWVWALDVLIVSVGGLVLGLALGRGGNLDFLGVPISVRGLYTPVLVLTVLVVARVVIRFRPRLDRLSVARPWLRPSVVAALACAGPLAPVLYGLGQRVADGRYVNPPVFWRSSPRGVDLLAFLHPNPNHAWSRWLLGDLQAANATAYVEYTAALSLVAIAIIVLGMAAAKFRPKAGWWWLTIGFAALALGPFVIAWGANTFVPGPWAVLRYVPLVGAARTPTRFSIVVALGLAMLMAGALAALGQKWPQRRRAIGLAALVLVGIELFPAPRTLYSAQASFVYDLVRTDPRPVRFLSLPFGVRDGVSSAGNFSARYQFNQTRHQKRLIGGYLSRVSRERLEELRINYPILSTIITMSEGHEIAAEEARTFVSRGPQFVERVDLGYVVIEHEMVTPQLEALAIEAFDLEEIARDGPLALYAPRANRR